MVKTKSWRTVNEREYYISNENALTIPSGLYTMVYNEIHGYGLYSYALNTDEYIEFPSIPNSRIFENVNNFIESQKYFKQHKLLSQFGILLTGGRGCGLTSITNKIIQHAIDQNCIAIYVDVPETVGYLLDNLKEIEPDRTIICVIDTLDFLIYKNGGVDIILDFFKQIKDYNNIIYVATANNIKNSDITSSFDVSYGIKDLTLEDLIAYFEYKIGKEETEKYKLNEYFSTPRLKLNISSIKKIFTHLCVYNQPIKTLSLDSMGVGSKPMGF